jgi:hypothetical protein
MGMNRNEQSRYDLSRREQQLLHGTLRRSVKVIKKADLNLTDRPLFWLVIGLVGVAWVYFVIGFP